MNPLKNLNQIKDLDYLDNLDKNNINQDISDNDYARMVDELISMRYSIEESENNHVL